MYALSGRSRPPGIPLHLALPAGGRHHGRAPSVLPAVVAVTSLSPLCPQGGEIWQRIPAEVLLALAAQRIALFLCFFPL